MIEALPCLPLLKRHQIVDEQQVAPPVMITTAQWCSKINMHDNSGCEHAGSYAPLSIIAAVVLRAAVCVCMRQLISAQCY
jgi:hypothetical protein